MNSPAWHILGEGKTLANIPLQEMKIGQIKVVKASRDLNPTASQNIHLGRLKFRTCEGYYSKAARAGAEFFLLGTAGQVFNSL